MGRNGATCRAITGFCPLLQSDHNAVGRAAGVHNGQTDESGAVRPHEHGAAVSRRPDRHAIDHHGERPRPAGNLERQRIGRPAGGQFEARAMRREHDARWLGRRAVNRAAKALQRRRQLGRRGKNDAPGRCRQRRRRRPGAGESIEQDRRRSRAPDQPRYRRAIGPTDPDANGHAAVEADRPGVAIAVRGTGLEGEPVMRRIFRWRRADKGIADVPGRHRIEQPPRAATGLSGPLDQ